MPFILSLDEGTTSARAALYDQTGHAVVMESTPVTCHYPRPGWVEQDAMEIWSAQMSAARRVIEKSGVSPRDVIAICAYSSIEYVAAFLGALRAGVAVAPLAPSSTPTDFAARSTLLLILKRNASTPSTTPG